MVVLVVATTIDPASIGPASSLLSMPGWEPGPSLQGIPSYVNGNVILLKHDNGIVKEDYLDRRWAEATGEAVDEVIFLSKHVAVSNRPALTIHPIGVPHLRDDEVPPAGGKPGWAAPPNPRMGAWMKLLKNIAESHNLVPEFEVTMEATHHGPLVDAPTMFLEIGSTEEYWKRQDAALVMASVGENNKKKVLLGIGGGHYVPRHMDIIMKDDIWVGHLLSGYSLPMEDPNLSREEKADGIDGLWRKAVKVSFEATKSAFPDGEILAHLDHKSFKSWQKNAIVAFLAEQNIKIGKPADFI